MIKIKRKIACVALWLFIALASPLQATQSNTAQSDLDAPRNYANNYLVKALELPDLSYIVIDYISHEEQDFISLLGLIIKLAYHAQAERIIRKAAKQTLLLRSAQQGHLACVKYLLEKGADINAKDNTGSTALIQSAKNGHLDGVKYLHEQGADIDAQDEDGNTALIWSAYEGHLDCVKYLCEQGADINAKDKDGDTALTLSARHGKLRCANYLRQQGAK